MGTLTNGRCGGSRLIWHRNECTESPSWSWFSGALMGRCPRSATFPLACRRSRQCRIPLCYTRMYNSMAAATCLLRRGVLKDLARPAVSLWCLAIILPGLTYLLSTQAPRSRAWSYPRRWSCHRRRLRCRMASG